MSSPWLPSYFLLSGPTLEASCQTSSTAPTRPSRGMLSTALSLMLALSVLSSNIVKTGSFESGKSFCVPQAQGSQQSSSVNPWSATHQPLLLEDQAPFPLGYLLVPMAPCVDGTTPTSLKLVWSSPLESCLVKDVLTPLSCSGSESMRSQLCPVKYLKAMIGSDWWLEAGVLKPPSTFWKGRSHWRVLAERVES